jgi:hypothetical protein
MGDPGIAAVHLRRPPMELGADLDIKNYHLHRADPVRRAAAP